MDIQLWKHDRQRPTIRVEPEAASAVVEAFSADAGKATELAGLRARQVIGDLRDERAWLMCACVPGTGALMYPRMRQDRRIELVQHPDHRHAEACPLARTRRLEDKGREESGVRFWPGNGRTGVDLLEELIDASGLVRAVPESVQRSGGKAGVRAADVEAHYSQLRKGLEGRLIADEAPADAMCAGSLKALSWIRRKASDNGGRYLLLAVADRLDAHGAEMRDGRIDADAVSAVGARSGPWVVLAGFEGQDRARWIAARSVLSRGMLWPVDSDAEREVAGVLLGQLVYWASKGVRVVLERGVGYHTLLLADGSSLRVTAGSAGAACGVGAARALIALDDSAGRVDWQKLLTAAVMGSVACPRN